MKIRRNSARKEWIRMQGRIVKHGDIWWCDLPDAPRSSHVTYGKHPVLVLGNEKANLSSPVVQVLVLTSKLKRLGKTPCHVLLKTDFLPVPSVVCPEQIRTINRETLLGTRPLGTLEKDEMAEVYTAVKQQLGLPG